MGSAASRLIAVIVIAGCLTGAPATANARQQPEWMWDLEDLMSLQVTSAGRKEQRLGDTAAAVFVVTSDDIRRSGMTSIPEVLRLVPGLHVARIDADHWAVTARGFNSRTANKLLVMVNGRSIYTSLFSGVAWEQLPVPLEAIDRIEVIRGPGASVWGANAVNGVINIITRAAPARRESSITITGGSIEHASAIVDFGAPLGIASRYRFFADVSRADTYTSAMAYARHLTGGSVGGTFEHSVSPKDTFYVEGSGVKRVSASIPSFVEIVAPDRDERELPTDRGWSWALGSRWVRELSHGGNLVTELSVSREHRNDVILRSVLSVVDLGVQHRTRHGRHDVSSGVAYRTTRDHTDGELTFAFIPDQHVDRLVSTTLQDDISLTDRVGLTLGTRLDYHTYVGWALQPSIRAHWRPSPSSFFWSALSKADRAPSRFDRAMHVNAFGFTTSAGVPVSFTYEGNPEYDAEHLYSLEAGYRFSRPLLQLDVATYYNWYTDLPAYRFGVPYVSDSPRGARVVVPQRLENAVSANTAGAEVSATLTPATWLRLSGAYTLSAIDIVEEENEFPPDIRAIVGAHSAEVILGGVALATGAFADNAPVHQGFARASASVRNVEADVTLFVVDELVDLQVPAYSRLDTRLAWRPRPSVEIGATIQNLLDERHLEFDSRAAGRDLTEVPRQFLATVSWKF